MEQLQLPDQLTAGMVRSSSARAEIVRLQAAGYGNTAIARSLNARAISTPTGRGQWWPETVKRHVDPGPWREYVNRYRRRRRRLP